jgi:hypothetical protein
MIRFIAYFLIVNLLYIYSRNTILNEKLELYKFLQFNFISSVIILIIIHYNIDYRFIKCKPDPGINCLIDYSI